MLNMYQFQKRKAISDMSAGNGEFQKMLGSLSNREIKILQKHPDLCTRIREIIKMNIAHLIRELKENFDLHIRQAGKQGIFIDIDKLEDRLPDWYQGGHTGWVKSLQSGEFKEWAREFLLQEVRINIWTRYIEHKKNSPTRSAYDYVYDPSGPYI